MIIKESAPVRISFGAAGDTDYYINISGTGYCVNATINVYSFCEIHSRSDNKIVLRSLETGHVLEYNSIDEIDFAGRELNIMKAIVKHFANTGIEIITYTDAPLESGLGGSAAHAVAMIKAFNKLNNKKMSKEEIAKLAYHIERNVLGIEGGYQDQWSAAYGCGINYMIFNKEGVKVYPLELGSKELEELENRLLLIFVPRSEKGKDIHEEQKKKAKESLALLQMKKDTVLKIKRALESRDFDSLAEAMKLEWKIKKQMTSLISNEYIEEIYQKALDAGAVAGRVVGAGAGGSMLFLCKPGSKDRILQSLENMNIKEIPFKIERAYHEGKSKIEKWLDESAEVKRRCKSLTHHINEAAKMIMEAYNRGGKMIIFGNGGSAADAQHVAGEMINKFRLNRKPLSALSLTTDSSVMTSIGNDTEDGFDRMFEKQIMAHGDKNDVAIAITTSDIEKRKHGHSANIYYGILAAKERGMKVIGLLSKKSKEASKLVDLPIMVPATDTPRIQEAHITILHMICDLVESGLFGNRN